MTHRRTYGRCTAYTEFEVFSDAYGITDPDWLEVEVTFAITDPGMKPDPWGDDPGAGPEGEIIAVQVVHSYDPAMRRHLMYDAPPHIDAWARAPERHAALFEQALESWEGPPGPDPDDWRDQRIDDDLRA